MTSNNDWGGGTDEKRLPLLLALSTRARPPTCVVQGVLYRRWRGALGLCRLCTDRGSHLGFDVDLPSHLDDGLAELVPGLLDIGAQVLTWCGLRAGRSWRGTLLDGFNICFPLILCALRTPSLSSCGNWLAPTMTR
jgi:hypothetical protein